MVMIMLDFRIIFFFLPDLSIAYYLTLVFFPLPCPPLVGALKSV